jgi:hypothetical protein
LWHWAKGVDDDPVIGMDEKVVHAWDFKRLAYDAVYADRWDEVIDRPFYLNATATDLAQAANWGNKMYKNRDVVHRLHRLSRNVRGKFIEEFLEAL